MLSQILLVIGRAERIACALGFVVMSVALIVDVIARQIFHAGLIGAPQVGVVAMVAVAMFGMGVATDAGQHLRPRVFDALVPARWSVGVDRLASLVTALFFVVMAALSLLVVCESASLGDRMAVLNWPIWPIQTILLAAFLSNAARYLIYVIAPDLAPRGDLVPPDAVIEAASGRGSGAVSGEGAR